MAAAVARFKKTEKKVQMQRWSALSLLVHRWICFWVRNGHVETMGEGVLSLGDVGCITAKEEGERK